MNNHYSPAEIKLFTAFGYENFSNFDEVPLYRICVEKAFTENLQGPHVEALRRAYKAIMHCHPYRHTPEFEELLQWN
jgi:hypothetical protein